MKIISSECLLKRGLRYCVEREEERKKGIDNNIEVKVQMKEGENVYLFIRPMLCKILF